MRSSGHFHRSQLAITVLLALATACGEGATAPDTRVIQLSVSGGTAQVRSRQVDVQVSAAGAAFVRLAEGRVDTATFRPYSQSIVWKLTEGDGAKRIVAQVRFANGRLSDSVVAELSLSEHVYASISGSDASDGSLAAPKRTVAAAIDAAFAEGRSRVRLLPGRFGLQAGNVFPVRPKSGQTLESADSTQPAVLDAGGTASVVVVSGVSGVVLRNLTLTGGEAALGGGLQLTSGSATGIELTITANKASVSGSGVYVASGTLELRRSVIASNLRSAAADAHGIRVATGTLRLSNNVIALHDGNGLLITGNSDVDVRNNIFYQNTGRGICELSDPMQASIRYNLFSGNGIAAILFGTTNVTASGANNALSGDAVFENLDGDPLFVAAAMADFRLQPGSPARRAGDPDPSFFNRDGSRNDIGHLGGR